MPNMGFEGVLNYKVGGQSAGGAWTELTNCRDVTLSGEYSEADVTTRAAGGVRQTEPVIRDMSVSFDMIWHEADTGFAAIRDAYNNKTMLGLQVLSKADGQGPQQDYKVFKFERAEPIDGAMAVSVTLKPCYSTDGMTWVS